MFLYVESEPRSEIRDGHYIVTEREDSVLGETAEKINGLVHRAGLDRESSR